MKKSFFEKFDKYKPEISEWQLLRKLSDYSVRADGATRTLELTLYFPELVSERGIAAVRQGLLGAYGINGVDTILKYPSELFCERAVRDIILCAQLTGFLPYGFFDEMKVVCGTAQVVLTLPYSESCLHILTELGTETAVSLMIAERFGLEREVLLCSDGEAAARRHAATEHAMLNELNGYSVTTAAPPPPPQQSFSGAPYPDEKRELARETQTSYNTIYAATAAPMPVVEKKRSAAPAVGTDGQQDVPQESRFLLKEDDLEAGEEPAAENGITAEPERSEERQAAEEENGPRRTASAFRYTGASKTMQRDGYLLCGRFRVYDLSEAEPIFGHEFDLFSAIPIAACHNKLGDLVFAGEVFSNERREVRRGGSEIVTIGVTDYEASLYLKLSVKSGTHDALSDLAPGTAAVFCGKGERDKYDGQIYVKPTAAVKVKRIPRQDTAEKKRVELHLHTVMSQMDATIDAAKLIATAKSWGHTAVAVTDHGNVQSFPDMMIASKKQGGDVKVLYGMEAYFCDDTESAVYGDRDVPLDGEFVVFDIETTGLSPLSCGITEIGAVLFRDGEVADTFGTYVDPGMPIPEEITALTGISEETVRGAPKPDKALRLFMEFAGERVLVAHNANFDMGFLRTAADRYRIRFNYTYLDTLALSRYLNHELKTHKQEHLAQFYGLGEYHAHRAYDDAGMLAKIFSCMVRRLRSEGVVDISGLRRAMADKSDPTRLKTYHMSLLVQNLTGLKNLYKLVSKSYLDYYYKKPRIPKTLLEQYRDGIIIGSACEQGEVFRAILEGRSDADIDTIASFYDYLEIMPLSNNRFLIDEGKVKNEEGLRDLNRRVVAIGERIGKPVCATGDAHFLDPEDEVYRKIILAGMKFRDCDRDCGLYFHTTDEMLREFAYLGEEKAMEVVVTNTNAIADRIEKIQPIPDGTYTPTMEGAEEELQKLCWDKARSMYEHNGVLPDIVKNRLDRELSSIIKNGFAVLYMIAQRLVSYSESLGYLVGSRGSVGSSFVATMGGISEVNPLPPHYYCPKCQWSEFYTDGSIGSGFDLPDRLCPECGTKLKADGHEIPFETFLGFYGDKSPDIDLNFSGDVQGKVHKYTEQLFGEGHVFRAGTIGTLADKTAYGFVKKYVEMKNIDLNEAEVMRIVNGCVGVKRTTGQHPGGIIVVPKEFEVYDFTPIQHPADDPDSDIITTHFQFSYLHDTILKLDELGHDIPTKYKKLEEYTHTSVLDCPMNDPKVYELFLSSEPLGISPKAMENCSLGTLGLPEMGTRLVIQVLEESKPKNFADLLQISGLTHGTDVWAGNAQELIRNGTCTISEVIGTRDGIMTYLMFHGLENSHAFKIMEMVRKNKKGAPIPEEMVEDMRSHGVPEWYIDSCRKIKYMFPKAHAVAYVISAIRLGWYKIYYPVEFYAAYLTVAPGGFDAEIVLGGLGAVNNYIRMVDDKSRRDAKEKATAKEKELQGTLYLVREALLRGIRFLPVDLYKSDASAFLVENGAIRMPFSSMNGLGERAAQAILEARREGEFLSREELRIRAKLNKSVVDMLGDAGVLADLTETNQLTLF
ncbi:MAG: PolC-type DNA polymerase III [Eubacteriales bacterium]